MVVIRSGSSVKYTSKPVHRYWSFATAGMIDERSYVFMSCIFIRSRAVLCAVFCVLAVPGDNFSQLNSPRNKAAKPSITYGTDTDQDRQADMKETGKRDEGKKNYNKLQVIKYIFNF